MNCSYYIQASCDSDQKVTYGGLQDYMGRWGAYLLKKGLRKGTVVAVVSPNTIHYPVLCYGAIRVGMVFTGVNPTHTAGKLLWDLVS